MAKGRRTRINKQRFQQQQQQQQQQQRSKSRGRGRSQGIGGYWGAVLETAIVPLTLLGLQQTFRRKKHVGGKTRRNKRR
jgi:hypothetical protein